MGLQPGCAVSNRYLDEIGLRFVEEAKVCTPRYVADNFKPGFPDLNAHRHVFPNLFRGTIRASKIRRHNSLTSEGEPLSLHSRVRVRLRLSGSCPHRGGGALVIWSENTKL